MATTKGMTREDKDFLAKHESKLSDSTKRAQWVSAPDEREDHPGQTMATRSHEVIQRWAEQRKAEPATVPGTEHGDHLGVLRFNFPGYGGDKLQAVSWDEWLKTFDDRKLVFLFQQHKSDGHESNFFHFDSPLREHD
jgi:hypothetical protein